MTKSRWFSRAYLVSRGNGYISNYSRSLGNRREDNELSANSVDIEGLTQENLTASARILKNSLFNLLAFLWPLGLLIITTPYIVSKLGTQHYGLWSLANTLLGFWGILDLGIGYATMKYVSQYYAMEDTEKMQRIIRATNSIAVMMGLLGTVSIITIISPFAAKLFKVPADDYKLATNAFLLASLAFFPNLLNQGLLGILKGLQNFKATASISVIQTLLSILFTVLILYADGGLLGVIFVNVLSRWIVLIILLAIVKCLVSVKLTPNFVLKDMKVVLGYGVFCMLTSLGGMVFTYGGRFLIGFFRGTSAVTYYVVPCAISSNILVVTNVLAQVLTPVFSSIDAMGDTEKNKEFLVKSSRLSAVFALGCGVILIWVSDTLMKLWMGQEFARHSTLVFQLQIIIYSLLSINAAPHSFLRGLGKPQIITKYTLTAGFAVAVLDILLIPRFGVLGAAMGLFGYLVITFPLLYIARNVFDVSGIKFWGSMYKTYFFIFFSLIVISYVKQVYTRSIPLLLNFILSMIVGGVLYIVSVLLYEIISNQSLILLFIKYCQKNLRVYLKG